LAAPIILLVAALGQIGQHLVRRRRHDLPLGPGLAAGYLAAVAVGVMWHALLGGGYT
jgi:prepilin signal peptidase PulO-like enzyme (type II secretory pathway)